MYQQTTIQGSPTEQMIVYVLASLMFSGVPLGYFGYLAARRYRLRRERAMALGVGGGVVCAVLLMLWLKNTGAIPAFFGMIGWFYGAWYAGRCHEIRSTGPVLKHFRRRGGSSSATSSSRNRRTKTWL